MTVIPESIFRTNRLTLKMISKYMKNASQNFLKLLLANFIIQLIQEDKDYEIDSSKLPENGEEIAHTNAEALSFLVSDFFERLFFFKR